MPRAPASGPSLLLLMAGVAIAAAAALALDDDDLVPRAAGCGPAPPPPCPPPCSANSTKSTQCLYYLEESHKEEVCGRDVGPERRRAALSALRMRHCCEHAVDAALPEGAVRAGGAACRRSLARLIELDHLAGRFACQHADLLTRYDCAQNFSIAHDCEDCKEAYRRWVCSSLVPHYSRAGERVRPCLSVCEDVEQQCPYLLPDQTVSPGEAAHPTPQYAGEPTFLCLDPNIPESGEQRLRSSRGDEDCCYTHCGAPGRGERPGAGGGGGGGGSRWSPETFGVCEHCPGRPPAEALPMAPTYRAGARPRTINRVFLLWTAWMTLLLQTDRQIYLSTIQCLLVMCALCVRTPMCWLKTKWRHSCS